MWLLCVERTAGGIKKNSQEATLVLRQQMVWLGLGGGDGTGEKGLISGSILKTD